MDRKIIKIHNESTDVHVEYFLTKRCNFDCWYCPSFIHDTVSPFKPLNEIVADFDRIVKNSQGRRLRVGLTGGEPTLHPNIVEVCRTLKERHGVTFLNVTTNGSKSSGYYNELLTIVDQLVISIHSEYIKIIGSALRRLTDIRSKDRVQLNVMMDPNRFDEMRNLCMDFRSQGFKSVMRKIRPMPKTIELSIEDPRDVEVPEIYSTSQLEHLKSDVPFFGIDVEYSNGDREASNAETIMARSLNRFNGFTCYVGVNTLMVDPDGKTYRATCRVGGEISELDTNPIVCTREKCTCAADIRVRKYGPD